MITPYSSMTEDEYKARNLAIINRARVIHSLPIIEAKEHASSAQAAPIKGRMHSSKIVHRGRHVKTAQDGTRLYAPACQGMHSSSVAYLGIVDATAPVTCKRCLAKD